MKHIFKSVQEILDNLLNISEVVELNKEFIKKLNYIEIPDELKYIAFQLVIFSFDTRGKPMKIPVAIDDLNQPICINGIPFELISIIMHSGETINSGHFVNYSKQKINTEETQRPAIPAASARQQSMAVKQDDIKWIFYDDLGSKRDSLGSQIQNNPRYTPYILLYKRIPKRIPEHIR